MKRKGISQEGLKLIACLTMLIDHIGAVLVPEIGLRVIGRVAFPIYCFLIAEGAHYTGNPRKYGQRLAVGMLLSELPFDCALFGGFTWRHQSVMVTLLLAFIAIRLMGRAKSLLGKLLVILPFVLAADWLRTDYGGSGVLMVAAFALTRERSHRSLWQGLLLGLICWQMGSFPIPVGNLRIPIEMFAIGAMIPICLYSGRKRTHSPWIQRGFYLFYPVHLAVLALFRL